MRDNEDCRCNCADTTAFTINPLETQIVMRRPKYQLRFYNATKNVRLMLHISPDFTLHAIHDASKYSEEQNYFHAHAFALFHFRFSRKG